MSIKHKSETPYVNAGPAVGKDSEPLKNKVLSTGEGHEYTKPATPESPILFSLGTRRAVRGTGIVNMIDSKG